MKEVPNKNTLWEKDAEWLRSSRVDMWNQDYFSFLVKDVLKINKPVKIVDFGCGIGYLASVLLPLLPKGSTYTGLDISSMLLDEGRAIFANSEWKVQFVEQDLNSYMPTESYDIAICQTLLIHMPSPLLILTKMIQSVVTGGRVICIEPNWAFTNFGVYRHGMEVYSHANWGLYQKMFDTWFKQGERDPYIGMKIPTMMHDLGLKNIDIRINDKATLSFANPNKEILVKDREERREKRFDNVSFYMNAGLDRLEAERHVESILLTEDYDNGHEGALPMVHAMAWLISYGEK